jgi:PAS domain S-box-containing protein
VGGALLIAGVRAGVFGVAAGTAILVVLGFVVFTVLILRDARDLAAVRRTTREAEARFHDLIESSPDGILLVDRDGLIRFANRQVEQLFGHSSAALVGRSVETLLPARFRAQHVTDRERFQAQPRTRPMGESRDLMALRIDGSEFPIEVSLSPMACSTEPMVIATVRDVTDRRRIERGLEASERRYRDIVGTIDEIVYAIEPGQNPLVGRPVLVSDRVEHITGYSPLEFREDPTLWSSLVHPDDLPSVASLAAQRFTEGRPSTARYRLRHKQTGTYRWIEDRAVPRVGPNGKVTMLFGVARDVSESVLAEEALRLSEERYREMFMNNVSGAYVSTPDGRLIACNPAFASMFGQASIEDALRMDLVSAYQSPGDRQKFLDLLGTHRRVENRDVQFLRPDGTTLYAIQNAVGIFDESGTLREIRGYLINTTGQRHLEDRLRQAQKMEAVGRLAGGVAHDFNNILTVIAGISELLLARFEPDQPGRADVEEIQKALKRASEITRQLLIFSRREIVRAVVLDVNQMLRHLDGMIQRLLGEDLNFVTGLTPDELRVKIDQGQLVQVVTNLAVNARDAMSEGGTLTIETAAVRVNEGDAIEGPRFGFAIVPGSYARISVSDTGAGINAEVLPHIFEPFFTTKERGRGTGLGLSTVYGIVKAAGGSIDVRSQAGRTTFDVYLPRTNEPVTRSNEGVGDAPGPGLEGRWMLIVEDDSGVRGMIRRALVTEGCRILEAENGLEALDLLERYGAAVDLVLTDVVMPVMGGASLAHQIERLYPGTKVLFMSGYPGGAATPEVASDKGSSPFLPKPFSPSELKARVRALLR